MNHSSGLKTLQKKSIVVSMKSKQLSGEPLTVDEELVRLQKKQNSWTTNIRFVTKKETSRYKSKSWKKQEWEEKL